MSGGDVRTHEAKGSSEILRYIERIDIPKDILDRNIKQLEEEIEERVRSISLIGKINF